MNRLALYNHKEENNQSLDQNGSGISSPANRSLQQSHYVTAIAKFTGHEGLQSPVTNIHEGERYTFDFFCPESEYLFKILSLDELDEYDKYSLHPGEVTIIIDLELNGDPVYTAHVQEREVIIVSREVTARLHTTESAVLYFDRQLWQCDELVNGLGFWSCLIPVVLLDEETDEE